MREQVDRQRIELFLQRNPADFQRKFAIVAQLWNEANG
jgi:hypothetical protein